MTVKQLIKELSKLPPNTKVGTFANERYDFIFTPIGELIPQSGVELHPDFRGRGKRVYENWVILVGMHQNWRHIKYE